MSAPLKLDMQDIQFGDKYEGQKIRQLMQQINAITRMNQRFIQLLRGGTVGQVLKKTGAGDLEATWVDP